MKSFFSGFQSKNRARNLKTLSPKDNSDSSDDLERLGEECVVEEKLTQEGTASIIKKGPFGGNGGTVNDMDLTGITRIVKIGIHHGDLIYGFRVYFERNGTTQFDGRWGGNRGKLIQIDLKANEYITSIKGSFQSYVTSLELETNLAVYGPYGKKQGKSFEMAAVNGQIIGFHGRSGSSLDAIGVYVKGFTTKSVLFCDGSRSAKNMDFEEDINIVNNVNTRHTDAIDTLSGCFDSEGTNKRINMNVYRPYDNRGVPFELCSRWSNDKLPWTFGSESDAIRVYGMATAPIKKMGSLGGDGGSLKDMDSTGITRIVKIGIRHSDTVHALIVYFERNGTMESTDQWGGNGGNLTEINLKTNEYIRSVKGYINNNYHGLDVVGSLEMETNLDDYGPYGTGKGKHFEFPAVEGEIIGFHGRSGRYLDALGVYVKDIKFKRRKSVLCGGNDGSPKDMDDHMEVTRIVKVIIHHSNAIDALSVCFDHEGSSKQTTLWGGNKGELTEIDLKPKECIMSVRGYVGYMGDLFIVRSLQLITNLKDYGPFGQEVGTPFELSARYGQIIGFHGRSSGEYLNAIGVYFLFLANRSI